MVTAGARPGSGTRLLAWAVCFATLAVVTATATLSVLNRGIIRDLEQANAIEIVLPIGFAILGALVASRQPGNALGWLFLAISLANAIPGATSQYVRYALVTQPDAPFSAWIPWFGYMTASVVYPAGLAAVALLLIPNGRFLSPRWRMVAWVGAGLTAALVLMTVLDPGALEITGAPPVSNPTGIESFTDVTEGPIGTAAFLAALGVLAIAGSAIVVRLRRSEGEERLQLRWVAYASAVSVVVNVGVTLFGILFLPQSVAAVVATAATVIGFGIAMPVSFAVAILRYRLYDLDLLLNRTILYGAVSVVLLLVFGIANVMAQRAVESVFDQRSDLVAAALGLGAGLAFGPVRRRIRPIVDRALPARSRLTLLFTDIVESTRTIVDLGDERWREVLDQYRGAVRQELARHRGREVNTAGDAFFASFDRPANALRCAIAIRERIGKLGLRARTGLHIGEVEMRGEQVSGLAVHAAARVMGTAGPDQVVISSDVARELPGVPVRDAGRHALRGVPGEWQLYVVEPAQSMG